MVTQAAVEGAKSWGANIVRVPLGEQYWVLGNCDFSPSYQATVDQVVRWITSLDMVALLDLHYNTIHPCGAGLNNMADEQYSPMFWQQVASRYASNPLVAFDLFNEPHDISNSVWLNGGLTTNNPTGVTFQAAGMQQLYNTVRSTGAQNLVFVSGLNWSTQPPLQLVSGTNIVYAVHAYTCPIDPPPNCADQAPYGAGPNLQPWVAFSSTHPIVVDEFGWPSTSDGRFNASAIAFAQAQGWGWAVWTFHQLDNPSYFDVAAFQNGTFEPTASGEPVFAALKSPP